jgi:hypothetical protein
MAKDVNKTVVVDDRVVFGQVTAVVVVGQPQTTPMMTDCPTRQDRASGTIIMPLMEVVVLVVLLLHRLLTKSPPYFRANRKKK